MICFNYATTSKKIKLAKLFKGYKYETITISNAELELVIEIFRHGARSPVRSNPKYHFGVQWDIGAGQLTPQGERQHYLLGVKRRKQYVEDELFLPRSYEPETIYAESTDYNRTQMSAYSHLLGLYPIEFRKSFNFQDENQNSFSVSMPIPVHMRDKSDIFLDYDPQNWPKDKELKEKSLALSDEEYTNVAFVQDLIKQLNKKLNLTGSNVICLFIFIQ